MVPQLKIRLDETTYYSTLGLGSNASEKEIHKSYVKLARELHPDKSKSDVAAELFKLISHAHSVLIDNEKKTKYDRLLLSKGLLHYCIKENCHRFDVQAEPVTPKKERSPRRPRPYEKQPYGFSTDTASPRVKVPIFRSFNLKHYQRKSFQHKEQTTSSPQQRHNGIFASGPSTPFNPAEDEKSEVKQRYEQEKEQEEEQEQEQEQQEHEPEEEDLTSTKSKLHKVNLSNLFKESPSSPFANRDHRHYARTKHEAKVQGRRSTSPIKAVPTTAAGKSEMSEGWESLKNLLEKFKQQEVKANLQSTDATTNRETNPGNEDRSDLSSRIRKAESQSIKLDDLIQSLPSEKSNFDMRHVSESVPAVKRTKLNSKISEQPAKSAHNETQDVAESLYVPVNKPLPRIYRTDHIPLDQYKINSKSLQWDLPKMPNFQCNILNRTEVEYCKELVKIFNEESNTLKQQLLGTLRDRVNADQELHDRLVKVENTANWVSSKDFDFEVVRKLSELQNRQRIVAQSFANLLKSAYTLDERHT